MQNLIDNNKHHEKIDDDQCCIVDSNASAERTQILLTSFNTMKNLTGKEELVFCNDNTHKLDLDGHQMIVMGVTDNQQKFHPVGFVFCSHGDETMC